MTRTPAQLHQIARDERARRKAALEAAGQGQSDRARYDDALWSNIEQMAGLAAGDPHCQARHPQRWRDDERAVMAKNLWATACKADAKLDQTIEANRIKTADLLALYRWVRPMGWPPYATEAA
ncbi:hypothetical protein U5A82_17330 [Sphingobium sp. CR2-8]|uniref:hypothetical protein n=1 Tax=Sphingobium sp. CR2-8 TaxID=1306534 RepID=UPI002DBA712D|nr:hypothetical protein [Sphingobium sp. CR2-8]MEC3912171.1 hypothetical protein [Sphingobium sp. CR2-8]